MTLAETMVEDFHSRWGSKKFNPRKSAVKEYDPILPGVTFYRFSDNSIVRVDRKRKQIQDIQPC